jgi:hypothetical protein
VLTLVKDFLNPIAKPGGGVLFVDKGRAATTKQNYERQSNPHLRHDAP